jgi:cytochrome c553
MQHGFGFTTALAGAVFVVSGGLCPSVSMAQPAAGSAAPSGTAAPAMRAAVPADQSPAAMGARIAAQGVPGTAVAACASCHGANGEGTAAAGFPRLAGQSAAYLAKQIENFAQNSRNNPVMSPIAKAMNAEQNMATSAYYASLAAGTPGKTGTAAAPAAGGARAGTTARGRMLASVGDDALQVQACANCHGPGGVGEGTAYPYLAGQHASYLTSALAEWKSGSRNNDPSGQMQRIASRLNDADVAALAVYYAGEAPPQKRVVAASPAQAIRQSARGRGGPPGGAGAQTGQGVGTEQGSPSTGGSQGPGGGGGTSGTNPPTDTGPGGGASR